MNIERGKRKSLIEEQSPHFAFFWSGEVSKLPATLQYESFVAIKKQKKLLKKFSTQWLGFSSPILYFAKKKKSGDIKYLNLQLISCKLYDYKMKNPKHPYKLVLRHHDMSTEFYIQDEAVLQMWISRLRNLCVMCDFLTEYNMSGSLIKGNISTMCWIQSKQSGQPYLAKLYNLKEELTSEDDIHAKIEKQVVFNQIKALRTIDHPNVLKLKEVHEFKDILVLVTDFIAGSSLLKYILSKGYLQETETAYLIESLLKTLQALHEKNIIHRNLKPENIMLDYTAHGTQLKLTDFGFSCTLDNNDKSTWHANNNICTKCGTPGYMPPEILANKKSTMAGDVFSMGVILYTCLTGEALFRGKSAAEIITKNMEVNYDRSSSKWNYLSTNAKDLLIKMTNKNPLNRPSIADILKHPFFLKQTQNGRVPLLRHFTVADSVNNASKNSIEESIHRKGLNSDRSINDVLQSVILPPSYWDFAKYGGLEVPEFYVKSNQTTESSERLASEDLGKLNKNNIQVEMIKGSLSYLEQDQITPRFKAKHPEFKIAEPDEEEMLDENLFLIEVEGAVVMKSYQKCYTFPNLHQSPFKHQAYSLRARENNQAEEDEEDEDDGEIDLSFGDMETARKLPTLADPIRKVLGSKNKILKKLQTEAPNK